MACTPVATATLFSTSQVTTDSLSTTTDTSVSTISGSTTVIVGTSCAVSLVSSACPSEVTVSSTSTASDTTTTFTSQVVFTVPITLTQSSPTETLFSTCSSDEPSSPVSTPPTSAAATSTNDLAPSVISQSPSLAVSASPTTLPDGQVSTQLVTFTSTPPPQTVFVSPSASPSLNQSAQSSSNGSSNLGAIIGGALGGFFGLLLLAGAVLCWRRRRRWDDLFEKESNHGIGDDDDRSIHPVQPAPYHYGLVGHTATPSISPPTSPRLQPQLPMTQHSRVNSSAATSIVSRESTVPLTTGSSDIAGALDADSSGHHRIGRLIQGNEVPFLSRPLQQGGQAGPSTLEDRRRSLPTDTAGSPTSPRHPPTSFFVTNAWPETDTTTGRLSAEALSLQNAMSSKRPIRVRRASSGHPVIVHTDGGRVDGASPTQTRRDEPPAYTKS